MQTALSLSETENQLRCGTTGKWRFTDRRISEYLRITEAEAAHLPTWRAWTHQPCREQNQRERKRERQELLLSLLHAETEHPSLRHLAVILGEHGYKVSIGTLQKDFAELGIIKKRRSRG